MTERGAPERSSVLGKLHDAQPASDVQRRVVRGALARVRRGRRARPLAWLVPTTAVAGAAALAWTAWWQPAPLRRERPGATATAVRVVAPAAPAAPQVWQTTDASRKVTLGPHRLVLAGATRLRHESTDADRALLRLERGRVEFAVHKLGAGQSFRVRTPHLGVRVVGTRFSVEVDGLCSRVDVREGIVAVVAVSPAGGRDEPLRLTAGQARTLCAPAVAETLSEGEALVREALVLQRNPAEARRALALLGAYLRRYPRGTLVEEALYHSILLHLRLGEEPAARALARRFLAGFSDTDRAARLRAQLAEKNLPR